MVRKLSVHAALSEEDCEAILSLPYGLRTFGPEEPIMREGDSADQCGVLISGFAYRQKITAAGARQIVALNIAGEPLGLQNIVLDVADHDVRTLTAAEVAFIRRADLLELANTRPAVGRAFLVKLLVEASIAREWLLNVGRRPARARLAHFLCEFAVRIEAVGLNDDDGYVLPMTQEQLGDALGLTSVHVNRTLGVLEAGGLIERHKREVRFPDWKRLRKVADFSDLYLHLNRQVAATAP